jgi:hypothetical protein
MRAGEHNYSKADSEALRETVIKLRDEALLQNDFEWAVKLSHVVAWMASAIEIVYPPSDIPPGAWDGGWIRER